VSLAGLQSFCVGVFFGFVLVCVIAATGMQCTVAATAATTSFQCC